MGYEWRDEQGGIDCPMGESGKSNKMAFGEGEEDGGNLFKEVQGQNAGFGTRAYHNKLRLGTFEESLKRTHMDPKDPQFSPVSNQQMMVTSPLGTSRKQKFQAGTEIPASPEFDLQSYSDKSASSKKKKRKETDDEGTAVDSSDE